MYNLDELNTLDNVLKDIKRLQERSELLDDLLDHYDCATKTFNIPEKWKGKVNIENLPAESPRHLIWNKISKCLSEDEKHHLKNYY